MHCCALTAAPNSEQVGWAIINLSIKDGPAFLISASFFHKNAAFYKSDKITAISILVGIQLYH